MGIKEKVLFAGFGGQGILSLGKLFADVVIENGLNASWLPSYGPEMRGGTCNCQVVMSDEKILSPIFTRPSIAIIMNQHSLNRFAPNMRNTKLVFINTSLVELTPEHEDALSNATVVKVPATDTALEIGNVRFANIVMLGAYAKHSASLPLSIIKESIAKKFNEETTLKNTMALEAGYNLV
ncbi:MAG: 2-oxoacid:acceptor oxidoreductase family protein [Defluviitaleaceae bacterium]|nr:2-oxoacid:acceptor oxidoreductase family protein [Defluviitaleaceae bacterium]